MQILWRMVQGTPNEKVYQSLVAGLDDPDFATSQCAQRLSMDRVIKKCKMCTIIYRFNSFFSLRNYTY